MRGGWLSAPARHRSSSCSSSGARERPDGFGPDERATPAAVSSAEYGLLARGDRERRVVHLDGVGGNIEDDRPAAGGEIAPQLLPNSLIGANQIGAEGLVVLEWHHPVGALRTELWCDGGELPVPGRV